MNMFLTAGTKMATTETSQGAPEGASRVPPGRTHTDSGMRFPHLAGALERQRFLATGYRVCPQILDRGTLAEVRAFLESRMQPEMAAAERLEAAGEGGGKTARDTRSGHFGLETRLDPRLWAIPRLPALRAVLREVLDSAQLFMHLPPAARFILPGNNAAGVPAHQDLGYNRHMSDFVTCWVPLVDIDDDCGGVVVYEGSATPCEIATAADPEGFWLRGLRTEGYSPVHCKLKVGDVLLMSKWIIHASMPNRSARTRLSIDYRFFGERDSSAKHHLDLQSETVIAPGERP